MRSILWIVAAAGTGILLAGCNLGQRAVSAVSPEPPPPAPEAAHLQETAVNYNDSGTDQSADSTVDRALMWSEKYAEAVDRLSRMQESYRQLEGENRKLTAQVAKLQADLAQSDRELTDANALLVEMRTELARWKESVLGYRSEMRDAQKAQLEALSKVIMLLGGTEEPAPAAAGSAKGADAGGDSAKAPAVTEKQGA